MHVAEDHVRLAPRFVTCYGTLVFSCRPCQSFMRCPKTVLTMRCCFSKLAPRNLSELISTPYIDPQPPDISRTVSSTGENSPASRSHIRDSASSRTSGLSSCCGPRVAGAAEARAYPTENCRLRRSLQEDEARACAVDQDVAARRACCSVAIEVMPRRGRGTPDIVGSRGLDDDRASRDGIL